MKPLLLLSFCLMVTTLWAQDETINDPNVSVRATQAFHAIEVSSGIDLYLSAGEPALAVSARDEESRDGIRTEVRNGVLRISYDWKAKGRQGSGKELKVYVAVSTLDHLSASGGSNVLISGGLRSDSISISLSGGSDLHGEIDARRLAFTQTGGSDANLTGRVGQLSIEASGGSDFSGYDLIAENCIILASGGSDIDITVNRELWAEATGASDISWRGSASVQKAKARGAGSVSHKS